MRGILPREACLTKPIEKQKIQERIYTMERIQIAKTHELGWLRHEIEAMFHRGTVVTYRVENKTLETVIENDEENIVDTTGFTPEIQLTNTDVHITDNSITLPPNQKITIEEYDRFYLNDVLFMFEKKNAARPCVYVYIHKPTPSELLGKTYLYDGK